MGSVYMKTSMYESNNINYNIVLYLDDDDDDDDMDDRVFCRIMHWCVSNSDDNKNIINLIN